MSYSPAVLRRRSARGPAR